MYGFCRRDTISCYFCFGFKNRSSKDKIFKNLPKNFENLKSNKEIVKTFGAKSNRFIIVKKGTPDMKKYIEELNLELQWKILEHS